MQVQYYVIYRAWIVDNEVIIVFKFQSIKYFFMSEFNR